MAEDNHPKLEAELEAVERTLRDALDFLSDDGNLTDKGIAAREALLREKKSSGTWRRLGKSTGGSSVHRTTRPGS